MATDRNYMPISIATGAVIGAAIGYFLNNISRKS